MRIGQTFCVSFLIFMQVGAFLGRENVSKQVTHTRVRKANQCWKVAYLMFFIHCTYLLVANGCIEKQQRHNQKRVPPRE